MAQTAEVTGDFMSKYVASFGGLPDGTAYVNPWMGGDYRPDLKSLMDKAIEMKDLTTSTGGAGTAGNALVPVWVDPRIVDTSRKYTPAVEAISRVTNLGKTADWNQVTAKGSAVVAAEGASLSDQTDTYIRQSTLIKFLYSKGKVTGPAQAAFPSWILDSFQAQGSGLSGSGFTSVSAPNAKQLDVIIKARALRELEEQLIFTGDTGSDANEFDGIVVQQGTTNVVDLLGAAIAFSDVEDAMKLAFDASGRPNLAFASSSVAAALREIVINTFQYRPADMTVKLPFGVSSHLVLETILGPVPVIPTQFLTSAAGQGSIYFMDMNYTEMRVLQDMTFEDLPKTDDNQNFLLKIYEALILRAPEFNAFVDNVA